MRLAWEVDEVLEKALAHATETAATLMQNHKLKTVHFKGFGKKFIKSHKIAPDSFVQLALQLAYFRDQKTFTATYESATTRTFLHGRTECIRSCTLASKDFCLAMEDKTVSNEIKAEKLRAAAQAHLYFLQQCMLGDGVDRHLLGLRVMAFYAGQEPEIFTVMHLALLVVVVVAVSHLYGACARMLAMSRARRGTCPLLRWLTTPSTGQDSVPRSPTLMAHATCAPFLIACSQRAPATRRARQRTRHALLASFISALRTLGRSSPPCPACSNTVYWSKHHHHRERARCVSQSAGLGCLCLFAPGALVAINILVMAVPPPHASGPLWFVVYCTANAMPLPSTAHRSV